MLHAVIMAGGVGVRFWPISRRQKPKQLLNLLDERSLIEQTMIRLDRLVPPERRWIVTNHEQQVMIEGIMPDFPAHQFILEPMGRNTAPAIGLSAIRLLHGDPDAVMIVLPSDHRIADVERFRACLASAVNIVKDSEVLATIGIEPSRPETGYGYIQIDRNAPQKEPGTYRVKTFAEKPNLQTAKLFLESGEFVWNSGIFIWRADVIMKQIAEYLPKWYSGLQEIAGVIGTPDEMEIARQVFASLKGISIDYGVMEHAPYTVVIRGDFGWSDVGSWDEIWRLLPQDGHGNAAQGEVFAVESDNNLIWAKDKLISLVGIKDLIVIDSGDAILICPRDQSQRVRTLVDTLEKKKKDQYL